MKKLIVLILATLTATCISVAMGCAGHTHSYSTSVTQPTCTEKGYTDYTCSCGETYRADYVDELGHSYTDTVVEPT